MQSDPPTFAELRRLYTVAGEDPPEGVLARLPDGDGLDAPLARLVIDYLHTLGLAASSVDQLFQAIQELDDEELSCFRVKEGVAVSAAAEGWWVLFAEEDQT